MRISDWSSDVCSSDLPAVAAWWKAKADEIYRAIPDFGGFLVKANSEGQPGPQDYERTHADGANMLAAAVKPHGGIVMWRAFVYAHANPDDRSKQAYIDFKPLVGHFPDYVLVQVQQDRTSVVLGMCVSVPLFLGFLRIIK